MAGQLQVVNSKVVGVGLVAGGPYGCAETGTQGLMPSAIAMLRMLCMSDKGVFASGLPGGSLHRFFFLARSFPKASKMGAGHV